ncbi:MAG: segregation/condensation protein A [Pseudomonadota bacterium]
MDETSPTYQVHLPVFEGPLDLLLHLIKINEIDIYDIPVAVITAQYLEYLDLMQELNLDVAGEYLLMAATLAYIKSKMLLPPEPETSEEPSGEDPREELVQRLLDYQRFKIAAEKLADKEILGRDIFPRSEPEAEEENEGIEEASLFDLIEALRGVIKKIDTYEKILDFTKEKISIKDKMMEILEQLAVVEYIIFQDLFSSAQHRMDVIVTFMAMLELIRSQKIRALQFQNFGTIRIYLKENS